VLYESGGDIYQIPAQGGQPEAIITEGENLHPNWGPNDSIVFASQRDGSNGFDLYVRGPDGTTERLTNADGNDQFPSFINNGNNIVFQSNRSGVWKIYNIPSDARNTAEAGLLFPQDETALDQSVNDTHPRLSPDNSQISFRRTGGSTPAGVHIAPTSGGRGFVLPGAFDGPAWSPDGTLVAVFDTNGNGRYVINVAERNARPIPGTAGERWPTWWR
jgi:Tol biopolymer transport system component